MAENIVAPLESFDEFGQSNYTPIQRADSQTGEVTVLGYKDQSGNIWDSPPKVIDDFLNYSTPKLVLSNKVSNDPYVSVLGLANTDIQAAKDLYNLKESDPSQFYKKVSTQLEDKIYNDWKYNNTNYGTEAARGLLENIKDIDPQSYYTAKLTDLGRSVGWQIGQNRGDRNAPTIEQIQSLIPEAQKAGLSTDQINSLLGSSVNQANIENQRAIANSAASGNFWGENLLGLAKVSALGLGAMGLDAALGGAAAATEAGAAGASTGTGLTGGAGGSTGLLGGGTVGSISAPTTGGALGLNAAAESAIAAGAGSGLSTGASSFAPAGIGGLNAALPAAGSVGGAGAMSAALPAGTIIGDGTLGTIMGASYVASAPGQLALDSLGRAIPASSIGLGSGAAAGAPLLNLSLSDLLSGAKMASGLLGAGRNPLQAQAIGIPMQQRQQRQYAGVDYSPTLNLLALKSPTRTNTLLG